MDPLTIVLVILAAGLVWLVLDLLLAGGSMTGGMVGGMMGAGIAPVALLRLAVLALLMYGVSAR